MSRDAEEMRELSSLLGELPREIVTSLAEGRTRLVLGYQSVKTADGEVAKPYMIVESSKESSDAIRS